MRGKGTKMMVKLDASQPLTMQNDNDKQYN